MRATRHGTVISDAALAGLAAAGATAAASAAAAAGKGATPASNPAGVASASGASNLAGPAGYAITLRWTGLDTDNDIVATTLAMNMAGSVDEFVGATANWQVPQQNRVVADDADHIALIAPGRVPLRRPDNDLSGLAPAPGWDARYDWAGYAAGPVAVAARPGAELHRQCQPEDHSARLAALHQQPLGPAFQVQGIEQMIEASPQHSLADLRRMHGDLKSLALPRLLQARSSHPLAAAAQQQLAGFDGTMAAELKPGRRAACAAPCRPTRAPVPRPA